MLNRLQVTRHRGQPNTPAREQRLQPCELQELGKPIVRLRIGTAGADSLLRYLLRVLQTAFR